jgi:hypothetical protein
MIEDKDISIKNQIQEDELDLISRIKTIWIGRKKIIKISLIFAFIGIFIAIFSEKEYKASSTIVPQTRGGKSIGGSLGGLAAIAGIDLGGSSSNDSGISPLLYPHIINSVPFQKELLNTPLTISGYDKPVTFKEYYTEIYEPSLLSNLAKYTIGLPSIIIKAIKGKPAKTSIKVSNNSQIYQITAEEKELIKRLKSQITLTINEKEGYISLSSTMPGALNAAELLQNAQEILQKYIIDFKIKKSEEQLLFINERFEEKEKLYLQAQTKLASFQDKNQFLNSSLVKSTQTRYQAEYDLAFNIYSELAKQQETQQIKVKEDTPVFTVLEPVSIPNDTSKPQRLKILFVWTFLGFILGIGIFFTKSYRSQLMSKISKD